MKRLFFVLLVFLFASSAYAQEVTEGTFTDPRDGRVYKTISFEVTDGDPFLDTKRTWFAENLDYKDDDTYGYPYNYNQAYRKTLGILYKKTYKVCPDGWHVAYDYEWDELINYFGGDEKAGIALKSTKGWKENGNGTNSSGFNIYPAGTNVYGDMGMLGYAAYFGSLSKYIYVIYYDWDGVEKIIGENIKKPYTSIRCVKDY